MTQTIRTLSELEALDPDTYLIDGTSDGLTQVGWVYDHEIFDGRIFPLSVIATGEQVRKATEALKKEQ